jgi:hypothetical protein
MTVGIHADVRRISQALTLPEYLEAWICMPDRKQGSQLVASLNPSGFRLDCYSGGRVTLRIIASYFFRHQRKMRLLWQKVCESNYVETMVDFRVRGNFGASILELSHTGFDNVHEYRWSEELWRVSLEKLTSLFLPSPSRFASAKPSHVAPAQVPALVQGQKESGAFCTTCSEPLIFQDGS